jgi:hypothetical protein
MFVETGIKHKSVAAAFAAALYEEGREAAVKAAAPRKKALAALASLEARVCHGSSSPNEELEIIRTYLQGLGRD